ncbi:MAG: Ig-like domain-containing protein, partial [Clostridia bacterium]|nr:Ig-like domain-containing protein [Clostridia bacterium]
KEPTCVINGLKTYTCERCGLKKDDVIESSGHNYTILTMVPTCTEQGYTFHVCSKCNNSYIDNYKPATGHNWDDGIVTMVPTCVSFGTKLITCTICKQQMVQTIEFVGHNYSISYTKPTCTEQGYTLHSCLTCGETFMDNYKPATGHKWNEGIVVQECSCELDGKILYECQNCEIKREEIVESKGHFYGEIVVEPTCNKQGYTMYQCYFCNSNYIDSYTKPLDHNWDDGIITKNATCTFNGEKTFTCKRCNQRKYVSIESVGHIYSISVIEPTCTEKGYTIHTCDLCGDYFLSDFTEPSLHEIVTITDSTEVVQRKHTECKKCKMIFSSSVSRRNSLNYIPIYTVQDFLNISSDTRENYVLMSDLDFSEFPSLHVSDFYGILDGNYHCLRNTAFALFDNNRGIIENLIICNSNTIIHDAGSFANFNAGTIQFCAYLGNISHESEFYCYAGGIVGENNGIIQNCYFKGTVAGRSLFSNYPSHTGGICGQNSTSENSNKAVITNCYAIGYIYAEGFSCGGCAGGITGVNYYGFKELSNCYFSGVTNAVQFQINNNYKASSSAICGYLSGTNCYNANYHHLVTNGNGKYYGGTKSTIYEAAIASLGDSLFYKHLPKDNDGNPILIKEELTDFSNASFATEQIELNIGENYLLSIIGSLKNDWKTNCIMWSSSNTTVAEVSSDGLVTAKSFGNTLITATNGEKTIACLIMIKNENVSVTDISLSDSSVTLIVGSTYSLYAYISPSNALDKTIAWSSSNTTVATVSSTGTVTAKSAGTTTITATCGGKSATCLITVNNTRDLSITNCEYYLSVGAYPISQVGSGTVGGEEYKT